MNSLEMEGSPNKRKSEQNKLQEQPSRIRNSLESIINIGGSRNGSKSYHDSAVSRDRARARADMLLSFAPNRNQVQNDKEDGGHNYNESNGGSPNELLPSKNEVRGIPEVRRIVA